MFHYIFGGLYHYMFGASLNACSGWCSKYAGVTRFWWCISRWLMASLVTACQSLGGWCVYLLASRHMSLGDMSLGI